MGKGVIGKEEVEGIGSECGIESECEVEGMNHMICCSSINDPSVRFICMPINNFSNKYKMRKIGWNPI